MRSEGTAWLRADAPEQLGGGGGTARAQGPGSPGSGWQLSAPGGLLAVGDGQGTPVRPARWGTGQQEGTCAGVSCPSSALRWAGQARAPGTVKGDGRSEGGVLGPCRQLSGHGCAPCLLPALPLPLRLPAAPPRPGTLRASRAEGSPVRPPSHCHSLQLALAPPLPLRPLPSSWGCPGPLPPDLAGCPPMMPGSPRPHSGCVGRVCGIGPCPPGPLPLPNTGDPPGRPPESRGCCRVPTGGCRLCEGTPATATWLPHGSFQMAASLEFTNDLPLFQGTRAAGSERE